MLLNYRVSKKPANGQKKINLYINSDGYLSEQEKYSAKKTKLLKNRNFVLINVEFLLLKNRSLCFYPPITVGSHVARIGKTKIRAKTASSICCVMLLRLGHKTPEKQECCIRDIRQRLLEKIRDRVLWYPLKVCGLMLSSGQALFYKLLRNDHARFMLNSIKFPRSEKLP